MRPLKQVKYQWVREGDVLKRGGEHYFYGHALNSRYLPSTLHAIFAFGDQGSSPAGAGSAG